jgi:hypothetical protein
LRHITEDKVMKVVAVLCCVIGVGAVLYVAVYAQYILEEPVDADFVYKYWAVYVVGMLLVWVGAGFAWPRGSSQRASDQAASGTEEEGPA